MLDFAAVRNALLNARSRVQEYNRPYNESMNIAIAWDEFLKAYLASLGR